MIQEITTEKFLTLFGKPAVRARPEQGREDDIPQAQRIPWTEYTRSDILMEVNQDYPYCIEFTPNGNFDSWCAANNKCTPKDSFGD